jgi:hypothetical protein
MGADDINITISAADILVNRRGVIGHGPAAKDFDLCR